LLNNLLLFSNATFHIIGQFGQHNIRDFTNNLNVESVLLIMFVPVIDFLRLIIKRVLDRRHPFQADENHFHHIINKNYNNKKYLILILFFYSPILFDYFFNINVYIIILIMTISYALILKKNISKIKASIK